MSVRGALLRFALGALFVLTAGGAVGCSGCGKSAPLAVLLESRGAVERDTGKSLGKWTAAEPRAEFSVGDGVKSGKAATATLELSDTSRLAMQESTVIRFLDRPPGKQKFDLEMGGAELIAGAAQTTLETDFGVAIIEPGAHVSLSKADGRTRFEVSVGAARLEPKGGAPTVLSAGEGISVGIGSAVLEKYEVGKPTLPEPPASASAPSAAPSAPPPVSEGSVTANVSGRGATVRTPGKAGFAPLPAGANDLAAGSTLRLPGGVRAEVSRGPERATLLGAGEFVVGQPGESFVSAQSGGVLIAATATELKVTVPGGSIVAKAGASADVSVRKDDTRVAVKQGSVVVTGPSGTEELSAGEEAAFGKQGAPEVVGRGPGYMDFAAGAGESFAVHDPSPPTAIAFATSGVCPEATDVAIVGRAGSRARGVGQVSVLFPPGANRYEVRCVTGGNPGPVAASGSISVLRDAGTARIPRSAPATTVDTDGRTYTVLYQNLLPKISVRWPKAPASGPYTLSVVQPGGGSQTFTSASPSYSFPAGALREGTTRLTFQAGGTSSKSTSVDIRFDNASPTATLTSPPNGSVAPGASVAVSGVAMEGWKISAGGVELPLDAQERFSGTVTVPGGQRALAIRFVHPRRGVHYYLRRASGH